jgi:hypothetical protein
MKNSVPEKTTGPSGVKPIVVLKVESTIISSTILYIAFIIRNLI